MHTQTVTITASRKLVEYDSLRHRVWIMGQRCHHGATGSLVAAVGCCGLALGSAAPGAALAFAGGALMAHDWKDRSVWFRRGRQI